MNRAEDGLPLPQRYWAILNLAVGLALSVLDSAIANIALPAIAKEIHASAAESIWVINAYQLAVVISLLPFASLGDIFGYRRIYIIGLVVFTGAALLSALSQSLLMLTLGRALQGLGAGGMMSVNTALVRFTYPRRQLGRGIAMVSVVVSCRRPPAPASPRRSSRSPRGRGCLRSISRSSLSPLRCRCGCCRLTHPPISVSTCSARCSAPLRLRC